MTDQKISDLNGKWAMLFKLCLLAAPFLIALQGWIVTEIHSSKIEVATLRAEFVTFAKVGPRYTPADARADLATLKIDLLNTVGENYPPEYLIKRIEAIERRIESVEKKTTP